MPRVAQLLRLSSEVVGHRHVILDPILILCNASPLPHNDRVLSDLVL